MIHQISNRVVCNPPLKCCHIRQRKEGSLRVCCSNSFVHEIVNVCCTGRMLRKYHVRHQLYIMVITLLKTS